MLMENKIKWCFKTSLISGCPYSRILVNSDSSTRVYNEHRYARMRLSSRIRNVKFDGLIKDAGDTPLCLTVHGIFVLVLSPTLTKSRLPYNPESTSPLSICRDSHLSLQHLAKITHSFWFSSWEDDKLLQFQTFITLLEIFVNLQNFYATKVHGKNSIAVRPIPVYSVSTHAV